MYAVNRSFLHYRLDSEIKWIFLLELFPLWWAKWYQFHARAMERKKNLSIIFLEIVEIGIL
jgi:hypothetical protein